MTELILLRHGETEWNRELRFQGQVDVPLNATGHAQAQRLAQRLAGEPIDHLVSSDLSRARQTADPFARQVQASRGIGLDVDAALRWRSAFTWGFVLLAWIGGAAAWLCRKFRRCS